MKWNWYVEVLKKYAVFDARARRAEFWTFALVNFVIMLVLGFISSLLSGVYAIAVLLPNIGVGVRRLHDTGRSGWWLLLAPVPLINLVLIYFFVLDSQPGTIEYGPNPKGA